MSENFFIRICNKLEDWGQAAKEYKQNRALRLRTMKKWRNVRIKSNKLNNEL